MESNYLYVDCVKWSTVPHIDGTFEIGFPSKLNGEGGATLEIVHIRADAPFLYRSAAHSDKYSGDSTVPPPMTILVDTPVEKTPVPDGSVSLFYQVRPISGPSTALLGRGCIVYETSGIRSCSPKWKSIGTLYIAPSHDSEVLRLRLRTRRYDSDEVEGLQCVLSFLFKITPLPKTDDVKKD